MRCLIAVPAFIAIVTAQLPAVPAVAQSAPPVWETALQPSPSIGATFMAFPSGGDPLRMRIADLIVANPKLAAEFVVYIRSGKDLNRAQKVAAERGLATAADRLGINAQVYGQGCPPGAPLDRCYDPWAWVWTFAALGIGLGGGLYGASQGNGASGSFFFQVASPH